MFSYSTGYYVSPPDDQYLKFKNRCSLMCTVFADSSKTPIESINLFQQLLIQKKLNPSQFSCISCYGNSYLCTYDLYSPMHNVLDVCISITRVSGRGLGHGHREFFVPCEMASSRQASVIWGPKNSRFPGPNPLPLAQVRDMHKSKTLCTGLYKSQVHSWFYAQETTREVSGPILWGVEEQVHKGLNHPAQAAQVHKETYCPARATPPLIKLIRNQEETVKCIICASSA